MEKTNNEEKINSGVREYFTKEINDGINDMSMIEMESQLKEFINTRTWIALLKYTGIRSKILEGTLRMADPVTNPSSISRAQGCLAGISDLESYVIELNAKKPENDSKEESDSIEGVV